MCPSDSLTTPTKTTRFNIKSAFDIIDSDCDGKISCDDLRAFYAGASPSLPAFVGEEEDVFGVMIAVADSNRNGYVEYDDFERVLNGKMKATTCGELLQDMFKVMDTDGDGKLSYSDLKSYMEWAGFSVDEEEIKAMLKLAGGNEIDGVSFDGLVNFFGSLR